MKRPDPSCEVCGGRGTYQRQVTEIVSRTCSACNGRGQVEAQYYIPVGVVWKLVMAVADRERVSIHEHLRKHSAATADVDTDCKGYC